MSGYLHTRELKQCCHCRALHDPDLNTSWLQNEKICEQYPDVVHKIIKGMIVEIPYCPACAEELNVETEFPSDHTYEDEPDEGSSHGPASES